MKNHLYIKFIILTFIFLVCFSSVSVVYGAWKGIIEITEITEAKQSTFVQKKYAIMTDGAPIGSDKGVTMTIEGEKDNIRISFSDGYECDTVSVIDSYGNRVGSFTANTIGYDEQVRYSKYAIFLSNLQADENVTNPFEDLTFHATLTKDGNSIEVVFNPNVGAPEIHRTVQGEPSFFQTIWGLITDFGNTISRLLENVLTDFLFIPLEDGLLFMISKSVGEIVTVDKIIFGDVDKLSIDYWNISSDDTTSVRAIMADVVDPWYTFFNKIAIIVYMMVLVLVGIQIMLASTADKKAKYKDVMVSWVVGVAILMFFPYAMKYIVKINDAVIDIFQEYIVDKESDDDNNDGNGGKIIPSISAISYSNISSYLGKDAFVELMIQKGLSDKVELKEIPDAMMQVRFLAKKLSRIVLAVVYGILIGETIALLFMYYKRAFMLAFLIVIFPLVAMTYVIDKVGDKKAQSLGIWVKEYVVNVVVQIFHAATYIVIVGSGFRMYLTSDGDQWLFLIMSVLFLFQGEKILRSIFGIKSSANTIGDLATSGLAAIGAVSMASKILDGGDKNDISGKQDRADVSGAENRQNQRAALRATDTPASSGADSSASGGAAGTSGAGGAGGEGATGTGNAAATVNHFDGASAKDTILQYSMRKRMARGLASGALHKGAGLGGAFVGATFQMSKGGDFNEMIENTAAGGLAGKSAAQFLAKPVTSAVNKVEQFASGRALARRIASGAMDGELGLDREIPLPPGLEQSLIERYGSVDPRQVVNENGETLQEIYRRACEEYAKASSTGGEASGQKAYFKVLKDSITKSE